MGGSFECNFHNFLLTSRLLPAVNVTTEVGQCKTMQMGLLMHLVVSAAFKFCNAFKTTLYQSREDCENMNTSLGYFSKYGLKEQIPETDVQDLSCLQYFSKE